MLSHFLKELKAHGYRQQDIAEKIGVTREFISNLSRGSSCSIETAIKLADAFNVSLDAVFGRRQQEQSITATQRKLLEITTGDDDLARTALRSAQGEKLIKEIESEGMTEKRSKAA